MQRTCFLVLVLATWSFFAPLQPAEGASRIFIAGGLSGEDYASTVFRRVGDVWEPPMGLMGAYVTEVELAIDSSGMLQDCTVKKSSGHDTYDVSACGAAYKVARFDPPPSGQPVRLTVTFQSNTSADEVKDPDEDLKRRVRELALREGEHRVREAGFAEDNARARAEAVARERGELVGSTSYGFTPGQQIPSVSEIMAKAPKMPRSTQGSYPRGQATKPRQVAERGPVISRYPPKPEPEASELVIAPNGQQGAPASREDAGRKTESVQVTVAERQQARTAAEETAARKSTPGGTQGGAEGARTGENEPARTQQASSQTGAPAASSSTASSSYVVPQPPSPPANVRGRVINPQGGSRLQEAPARTASAAGGTAPAAGNPPARGDAAKPVQVSGERLAQARAKVHSGGTSDADRVQSQPPYPYVDVRGFDTMPAAGASTSTGGEPAKTAPKSAAKSATVVPEKKPARVEPAKPAQANTKRSSQARGKVTAPRTTDGDQVLAPQQPSGYFRAKVIDPKAPARR